MNEFSLRPLLLLKSVQGYVLSNDLNYISVAVLVFAAPQFIPFRKLASLFGIFSSAKCHCPEIFAPVLDHNQQLQCFSVECFTEEYIKVECIAVNCIVLQSSATLIPSWCLDSASGNLLPELHAVQSMLYTS